MQRHVERDVRSEHDQRDPQQGAIAAAREHDAPQRAGREAEQHVRSEQPQRIGCVGEVLAGGERHDLVGEREHPDRERRRRRDENVESTLHERPGARVTRRHEPRQRRQQRHAHCDHDEIRQLDELVGRGVEPDLLGGADQRDQDGVDPEVHLRDCDRDAQHDRGSEQAAPVRPVDDRAQRHEPGYDDDVDRERERDTDDLCGDDGLEAELERERGQRQRERREPPGQVRADGQVHLQLCLQHRARPSR